MAKNTTNAFTATAAASTKCHIGFARCLEKPIAGNGKYKECKSTNDHDQRGYILPCHDALTNRQSLVKRFRKS